MIVVKISSIPSPVLALASKISSFEQPTNSIICDVTFSISALGKSTLLITGIISKSLSIANK